jgi:hypothetical protein
MIAKTQNKFKNTLKALRKSNTNLNTNLERKERENYYKHLNEIECEENIEENNEMPRETKCIGFNDLPEDTIYQILAYLPYNTRIEILKRKYNKHYLRNTLNKMSQTSEGLTQLWKCATTAIQLKHLLCINKVLPDYSIRFFKKDLKLKKVLDFSEHYKSNFSEIILTIIRHYSIIYKGKFIVSKKTIECVEEIMVRMFTYLVISPHK